VLEIEHAYDAVGADDRSAEQRLELVFGQIDERLEARIFAGAFADGNCLTLGNPPLHVVLQRIVTFVTAVIPCDSCHVRALLTTSLV
jgi:hypothetical protein